MSSESTGILVFDLGLTNCKAIVFSPDGNILARASETYPTYHPIKGAVEQDPDEWWQAIRNAASQLWETHPDLASRIDGISVTGHMHALVCLGEKGRTIARSLVLGDQRSVAAAYQITQSLSLPLIYNITGARMDASMPAAKIRWVKDHNPQAHSDTRLFTGCKDYIRHLLTGDRLTDASDACAMSLYDIQRGCWSAELLEEVGIGEEQLPEIVDSTQIAGALQSAAALELGLTPGIPVVVGGGDDIEILGNGLMAAGRSLEHLGTTGSILTVSDVAVYDPEMALELYPHVQHGLWVIGGSITTAGAALDWACHLLGFENLEQALAILDSQKLPPIDDELIFLPHLLGERSPSWQPRSRGSWVGLTTTHTPSDLMRSAFVGTVFALKHILEKIESLVGLQDLITVSAREDTSEAWLNLRSNIYQRPLALLKSVEPTALGAMILAAVGIGSFASLEDAVQKIAGIERTIYPKPEKVSAFRHSYDLYYRVQETMRPYWLDGRDFNGDLPTD